MSGDRAPWIARLQVAACLAVGLVGLLVYAFPGFMSADSLQQLGEARSHDYGDWHPPAMAGLWTIVELFIEGPAGMLILQGTLFATGTYRILRRSLPPRTAALAASLVLLFPPVLAPMGVIWKDCQMAAFLMFGASLLVDDNRWQRLGGVGMLAIATAIRPNAAAATLPLLLVLFRWSDDHRRWQRIALASAVWLGTFGAATAIDKQLTKVEHHVWYVGLAPADIIGVLKQSRTYSDAELLGLLDGAPLVTRENIQAQARRYYNPYNWWFYTVGPNRLFDWPVTAEQRGALARAWRTLVLDNPRAFLLHRLRVWRGILGLSSQPLNAPVYSQHVASLHDPFTAVPATGVQAAIADVLGWLAVNTALFRPYIYLFLSLLFLVIAWPHRDALALLASGVVFELGLFPIGPSNDVRYSLWMVTTTVVAAIILVARRVRRVPNRGLGGT